MGIKGKVWPQILLSPVGGDTSAHYQFGVCLLKMVTLVCGNILILTARCEGTNPGFSKHFYVYNLLCSLQKSCEVGSGNTTIYPVNFQMRTQGLGVEPQCVVGQDESWASCFSAWCSLCELCLSDVTVHLLLKLWF